MLFRIQMMMRKHVRIKVNYIRPNDINKANMDTSSLHIWEHSRFHFNITRSNRIPNRSRPTTAPITSCSNSKGHFDSLTEVWLQPIPNTIQRHVSSLVPAITYYATDKWRWRSSVSSYYRWILIQRVNKRLNCCFILLLIGDYLTFI